MYSWVRLSDLAKWSETSFEGKDFRVTSISSDTRTVKAGEVFVALKGPNFDGHHFLEKAVEQGASAIISEKALKTSVPVLQVKDSLAALIQIASHLRAEFKGVPLALTGSAGKSSTKEMIGKLLGENTVVSPGSFNTPLGLSKTLFLIDDSTQNVVFEMGMRGPGEILELCEIAKPKAVLITNIGDAHVGRMGGEKFVYLAKKEIFDYLAKTKEPLGVALNCGDEKVVRAYDEAFGKNPPPTIRYCGDSTKVSCEVSVKKAHVHPESAYLQLEMQVKGKELKAEIPIFGRHHAENFAASVAMATLLRVPLEDISHRLGKIRPSAHRGAVLKLSGDRVVIDEAYNSNPTALRSSLRSLSYLDPKRRKLLFLGDMLELGDFAQSRHEQAGEEVVQILQGHAFVLIGIGPLCAHLLNRARTLAPHLETHAFADAASAANWLPRNVRSGDLLFIKGSRGGRLESLLDAL